MPRREPAIAPRLDFAGAAAEYLLKSQSFVIPGHTHDVLSSSTCAREIMKRFLTHRRPRTPGAWSSANRILHILS